MISYDTRLAYRPPISDEMRAGALAGMKKQAPAGYDQTAKDTYNAAASVRAADYSREADNANMQYGVAQQQAQRGLALQGLQQMAGLQQLQNQYQSSLAGSLLGGLFR